MSSEWNETCSQAPCNKSKKLKTVKAVIGQYHDYVAMNAHEIVLDPTPEDCDRIWRESKVELNEPPICERCEDEYSLRDGMEPTKYCDACAHQTVSELEQPKKPWESFDAFGEWCESVWMGRDPVMGVRDLTIAALGIGGEAGEVQEKIKKEIRDGTDAKAAGVLKELGDVIFYACTIARYYGYKPSDILKANYDKLESRMARGTQRGSGDSR